jgi:hypothetical protein
MKAAAARIERAAPEDADAIVRLLEPQHRPLDGLRDHLATTLVARRDDGQIVGSAVLDISKKDIVENRLRISVIRCGRHARSGRS